MCHPEKKRNLTKAQIIHKLRTHVFHSKVSGHFKKLDNEQARAHHTKIWDEVEIAFLWGVEIGDGWVEWVDSKYKMNLCCVVFSLIRAA